MKYHIGESRLQLATRSFPLLSCHYHSRLVDKPLHLSVVYSFGVVPFIIQIHILMVCCCFYPPRVDGRRWSFVYAMMTAHCVASDVFPWPCLSLVVTLDRGIQGRKWRRRRLLRSIRRASRARRTTDRAKARVVARAWFCQVKRTPPDMSMKRQRDIPHLRGATHADRSYWSGVVLCLTRSRYNAIIRERLAV